VDRTGVAIPNRREAYRARRLTGAQREELHACCPHAPSDCPIEAALDARLDRSEWQIYLAALVALCIACVALALGAPSLRVLTAGDTRTSLAALFGVGAACFAWMFVPRMVEARRAELRDATIAAAGPPLDPWQ
jgi:hypothetical protein